MFVIIILLFILVFVSYSDRRVVVNMAAHNVTWNNFSKHQVEYFS
jgi:hypothetical protein